MTRPAHFLYAPIFFMFQHINAPYPLTVNLTLAPSVTGLTAHLVETFRSAICSGASKASLSPHPSRVKTEMRHSSDGSAIGYELGTQAEIHFSISDSLGTLPATLTSLSTTTAGVMKTPYLANSLMSWIYTTSASKPFFLTTS